MMLARSSWEGHCNGFWPSLQCFNFCSVTFILYYKQETFFKNLYQTYIETYIWNTKAEFPVKTMKLKENI